MFQAFPAFGVLSLNYMRRGALTVSQKIAKVEGKKKTRFFSFSNRKEFFMRITVLGRLCFTCAIIGHSFVVSRLEVRDSSPNWLFSSFELWRIIIKNV